MSGSLFNNNFLLGFAFLGQDFEDQQDKLELALAASQFKSGFGTGMIALKQRVDSHVKTIEELESRTSERDTLQDQVQDLTNQVEALQKNKLLEIIEAVKKLTCTGDDQLRFNEEELKAKKFRSEQIRSLNDDLLPELLLKVCDLTNPAIP